MTPNAKWSMSVCERANGRCEAMRHDRRCRSVGHHGHHIVFKSHCPAFTHYTVIANGVWLSMYCHDLAHKTHNKNISVARKRGAVSALNAFISEREPLKPELLVKPFEEAA